MIIWRKKKKKEEKKKKNRMNKGKRTGIYKK